MPVDLTRPRESYAEALFGDVATRTRDSVPDLEVAGLFAARQMQQDRSQAVRVPMGSYTYECAVGSDVQLDDALVFAGQSFRVVYAPPTGALDLAKIVGMDGL